MPMDPLDLAAIGVELARLTELVRDAQLRLPGRFAEGFDTERDEILLTFDGYLEPRIGAPDAPIVAAIVGPSGAGKSTLLNSIAQEHVSHAGVVRPTTAEPIVWADSGHEDGYWAEFSERVSRHLGQSVGSVLGESSLTEHLTIIDTPPLRLDGQAGVAAQAVAIADLCIFVTTPTRYADALAWKFLRRTRRRGVPILFVVNRLPADPDDQELLLADFARRLHQRELLSAPDPTLLFGVSDGEIDRKTGGREAPGVDAIRKELAEVADPVYRYGLVDETVYATARMVAERARSLTRPMAAESPIVARLLREVTNSYEYEATLLNGQLGRGDLASSADNSDWSVAMADLAAVVTRRAGTAAHAAATLWSAEDEAADLLATDGAYLWRHGAQTVSASSTALAGWESGLDSLAAAHARSGRLRFNGARRRAVAGIWRSVLTGKPLPYRSQSKFSDGGKHIVELARNRLHETLRVGLWRDSERFTRLLDSDGAELLYAQIVERADSVDARLDQLAGQLPESWSEHEEDIEVVDDVVAVEIGEGSTVVELGGEQLYRRIEVVDSPSDVPESTEALVDAEPESSS